MPSHAPSTDVDQVRTLFASLVDPSSGAAEGEIGKTVKYADVANLCVLLDPSAQGNGNSSVAVNTQSAGQRE